MPNRDAASPTLRPRSARTSSRRISPGCTGVFITMSSPSSVVVLVVDEFDVAIYESERDPPVAVNPDRPVAGEVALQLVRTERRDRDVGGSLCHVKQPQDAQQLRDVVSLDASLRTLAIQPLHALVSETDDHQKSVACSDTRYKGA